METSFLFSGWEPVLRAGAVAAMGYAGLVLFLRAAGKRTLSKLNAFDWTVTVAMGSTLATTALSRTVALADGLTVLATLIVLQFVVSWTSVRWPWFRRVMRSEPSVLYRDGAFDYDAMRRERITEGEVLQAVRSSGGEDLSSALIVILQTEGSLAAVLKS